jgi:hypothetical protein
MQIALSEHPKASRSHFASDQHNPRMTMKETERLVLLFTVEMV